MAEESTPQFRELTLEESHRLLASNNIGRIAFTVHDRVDIQPIHYVSDGDWIFGRTGRGAKLSTLLHHPWCAFEIDEVRGLFDWSSVVVKGNFSILDPKIGSLHTYQRANRLLHGLVPGTFTEDDPAPHRDVIFGIFAHEITGRTGKSIGRLNFNLPAVVFGVTLRCRFYSRPPTARSGAARGSLASCAPQYRTPKGMVCMM